MIGGNSEEKYNGIINYYLYYILLNLRSVRLIVFYNFLSFEYDIIWQLFRKLV